MQVFSRRAATRLVIASVLLGAPLVWAYVAMIRMPGRSFTGGTAPLDARGEALRDQLRHDVEMLAGDIGERSVQRPEGLHAAADRIESAFAATGLAPRRQTFVVQGVACDNIEAEIVGDARPADIVVIGAHYDSLASTVGADDNASGSAALLALARAFATARPRATLRFVAFVNEEPPYFQTSDMGSFVYAKRCRDRGEHVVSMVSLETIGYYADADGSQKYPPFVGLAYPSTGNFVGFVGDRDSAALVRRAIAAFRGRAKVPSEGGALFAGVPGVGWSDQWSFWQVGYPAIMVTDTAPFRNPDYHTRADTPDKLDYDRMARVVDGLRGVVEDLVGGT